MSDGAFLSYLLLLSDSTKTRKSIEMQFDNEEILQQIDASFQRMHIQLDRRLDQLVRQYRRSSQVSSVTFCPLNQSQLEQTIENFGQLKTSVSLNDVHKVTNSSSIGNDWRSSSTLHRQLAMQKTPTDSAEKLDEISSDGYRTFGKRGRQKGQFSNPQDVLFVYHHTQPLLFVSDTINQNVQSFSLDSGQCTNHFPSTQNRTNLLRRPIGLSIGDMNNTSTCFVADYDQHCITSWTIDPLGQEKFRKRLAQQSLIGPKGLCFSKQSERLVVADNRASRICLFDLNGSLIHRFGSRGSEEHELAGPHYVRFLDENDDRVIVVTDFYNNSVKIFDLERQGQLVSNFGCFGTKNGQFQAPTGLAIDYQRGYIFVADWGNNRVQIFDRQGTFLRMIDSLKSDVLYGPQGLDFDPISRTLAIANSGKHCALMISID